MNLSMRRNALFKGENVICCEIMMDCELKL